MKPFLTSILIFVLTLPALAVAPAPSATGPYQLWVEGSSGAETHTQYVHAETAEALDAVDFSAMETWAFSRADGPEDCTISITVKVRFGFDSNFVEASGTVSGIPCDGVVEAIKALKAQLMAGIK
ncbi:hypothetical protein OZ410_07610 [Robiginitalea sp. M366]|uniref:hypothetical protein n=1 Tax=Robiginitalea aestuariiviva TaxID=3036903 RepID=UPI00240D8C0F|nr:hypothetical protein [Robiginitalea aestuariiviva]MDG1572179.1 hypothetical protein [Robiginitalea aestuariiviva]